MKTIKTEINLYEYDELNWKAKEKAFNEHEVFLRCHSGEYEEEGENGEIIVKYDNMDEWSAEDIKDFVEDSIRINEYLFFESGEMAHICHFTGKHEKAGTTEFYFQGKTYIL